MLKLATVQQRRQAERKNWTLRREVMLQKYASGRVGLGLNLVPKKLSVTSIGLCRFSVWSVVTGLLLPEVVKTIIEEGNICFGAFIFWLVIFFLTDVFQIFECFLAREKANMILDRQ